MKKKIISGVVAVSILFSSAYYLYTNGKEPTVATTYTVSSSQYVETITNIGYVTYDKEVVLKTEVGGEVKDLLVEAGDVITSNATVLTIDDSDARDAYDELSDSVTLSEARLNDYMTNYNTSVDSIDQQRSVSKSQLEGLKLQKGYLIDEITKNQALVDLGALPQAQVDQLQQKLELLDNNIATATTQLEALTYPPLLNNELTSSIALSRKQLDNQLTNLEKYILKTPLSGLVKEVKVEKGEILQPGEAVMTIASIDNKHVVVAIDEKYLPNISLNQEARLFVEAYGDTFFKGTVTKIAPAANADTGTVDITIRIEEKPELFLEDLSVRVELITQTFENAIVIDGSYVVYDETPFVFQVDEAGIVYKTPVEVYNKNQTQVMIVSGLTAGSEILYPEGIEEGVQVEMKRVDDK